MNNIFTKILKNKQFILLAEIKIKSPTEGVLGRMSNIEEITKAYTRGRADMISVVTEQKLFGGSLAMIEKIKKVTKLPVLCKDFIVKENQLKNARRMGADAILLLAFLLGSDSLIKLYEACKNFGLIPVVEVDNEDDLKFAVSQKFPVIAVNARNLRDFSVDREKAIKLLKKIPGDFISLAFSGVRDKEDVKRYLNCGAKGVLVGTSLMRAENKSEFLRELRAI